jgi:hypothetical protein
MALACLAALAFTFGAVASATVPTYHLVTDFPTQAQPITTNSAPEFGWTATRGDDSTDSFVKIGAQPDSLLPNGSAEFHSATGDHGATLSHALTDISPTSTLTLSYETRRPATSTAPTLADSAPAFELIGNCPTIAQPTPPADNLIFSFYPYDQPGIGASYDYSKWSTWNPGADTALWRLNTSFSATTGLGTDSGTIGGSTPIAFSTLRAAYANACVAPTWYRVNIDQIDTPSGVTALTLADHVSYAFGASASSDYDFALTGSYKLTRSANFGPTVVAGSTVGPIDFLLTPVGDAPDVPQEYISLGGLHVDADQISCTFSVDGGPTQPAVEQPDNDNGNFYTGLEFGNFALDHADELTAVRVYCTFGANAQLGTYSLNSYGFANPISAGGGGSSSNTPEILDSLAVVGVSGSPTPSASPSSNPILAATGTTTDVSNTVFAATMAILIGSLMVLIALGSGRRPRRQN